MGEDKNKKESIRESVKELDEEELDQVSGGIKQFNNKQPSDLPTKGLVIDINELPCNGNNIDNNSKPQAPKIDGNNY